jgi:hypothetical protein
MQPTGLLLVTVLLVPGQPGPSSGRSVTPSPELPKSFSTTKPSNAPIWVAGASGQAPIFTPEEYQALSSKGRLLPTPLVNGNVGSQSAPTRVIPSFVSSAGAGQRTAGGSVRSSFRSSSPSVSHLPALAAPTRRATSPPNGCGSETGLFTPNRVPQSILGASFGKACDAHDICYGTPWANKAACDNNFLVDLAGACHAASDDKWKKAACMDVARDYYLAVRLGGGKAYREAQLQAIFPPQTGPSLFGPSTSAYDKVGLFPKSATRGGLSLGVDTTLTQPTMRGSSVTQGKPTDGPSTTPRIGQPATAIPKAPTITTPGGVKTK